MDSFNEKFDFDFSVTILAHVGIAIYLQRYRSNLNVREVGADKYYVPEVKLQLDRFKFEQ